MDSVFLTSIQESPGDQLPRLVYADWLEERSDDRHELIRLLEQVRPDIAAGAVPEADAWLVFQEAVAREWPPGTERALLRPMGCLERPLAHYRLLACDLAERGVDAWARYNNDALARRWLQAGRLHVAGTMDDAGLREVWHAVVAARNDVRQQLLARIARPLSAALEPWQSRTAARRGVRAVSFHLGSLFGQQEFETDGRWQFVRHVEYALDFVGLPTLDAQQPE